jgi:hypothetical protein
MIGLKFLWFSLVRWCSLWKRKRICVESCKAYPTLPFISYNLWYGVSNCLAKRLMLWLDGR